MRRCVHRACRPKSIWHIDGLCVNGCICGFSRKVIWLNVYQTNNDPKKIISGYFLEDDKANGGCPLTIRTDHGTENGHDRLKAVLLLWIFVLQVFVMLSCASVCWCLVVSARPFIDALWSPAGKGLTSWLSFVMSNSEFLTFPLISWVRCGTWL